MRRAWLRRKRWLWSVAVVVAAAMFGVFWWLTTYVPVDTSFARGLFAGLMLGAVAALRTSPPSSIARWEEGAYGEEETAKQLSKLERDGWVVLHDLAHEQGNFDHVVLGPNGVFCLNSKWSSFRLEADGRGGLVGRSIYDNDLTLGIGQIVSRAVGEAVRLKETIERRTGQRVWVQAVVVWWGGVENDVAEMGHAYVVSGARLADHLRTLRGRRISEFDRVVDALAPGRHARRRAGLVVGTDRIGVPR